MSSRITVRRATLHDTDWILEHLPALSTVIGERYSLLPETREEARSIIDRFVAHTHEGFFTWIAERWTSDGEEIYPERLGFFVAQVASHPFNPALRMCSALLIWVIPSARRSAAMWHLFNAFVAHGKRYAHWINFSCNVWTNIRHESLERRGFRFTERCYLMEN